MYRTITITVHHDSIKCSLLLMVVMWWWGVCVCVCVDVMFTMYTMWKLTISGIARMLREHKLLCHCNFTVVFYQKLPVQDIQWLRGN